MNVYNSVVCVSLLLLQVLIAVDGQPPGETDQTEYILNGAESVEVPCGKVPDEAVGIEWKIYDTTTNSFKAIFKFYHINSHSTPSYRNGYTEEKYTISASVNTSLVVKDIRLSDTGRFSCSSVGGDTDDKHNVMLQVVVPPTDASVVTLVRGDSRTKPPADLKGPYLENQSEEFSCYIRDILPGKDSTLFRYNYSRRQRLNSRDDEVEVVESAYHGGTKFVEWNFSTSFNRTDNGMAMKCLLNWKAGQYNKTNLGSEKIRDVQVYFGATKLEMTASRPGLIKEKTEAVFKCLSGEGNPLPEIKWSHGTGTNRGIKGRYEAFKTESLLELRVDKTMNKEEVRCFIEADEARGQTRKEEKVNLKVEFVATKIEMITFPPGDVKEGDTVVYVCETDSAYPHPAGVLWSVDGESVRTEDGRTISSVQSDGDYNGQKTKSTLRLKVNRSMNKKQVTCVLENNDQQKKEHSLNVKFSPDGLDMDIGEAVKENTEKTVTCRANSANPASLVSMQFFIDGTEQRDIKPQVTPTAGTNGGQVQEFKFVFTSTRQQNGKPIKCRLLWDGTFTNKKRDDTLNITYPPEVTVDGTTAPVVEYTTRDLECVTTGGNPSSQGEYEYTWMYKPTYTESKAYLPVPNENDIINGGRTLQLKDLGYEDMAGTYKCTVTSIGGQNNGTSNLTVYYPAKSENSPEDRTVFAAVHTAVNLTMKFRMNPVTEYRIEWSMGDITVSEANLTLTQNEESVEVVYFIADVHSKSLGNHTVKVINTAIKNGVNDATFIVTLTLQGPPEKPMKVSVTVVSNSITVSWEAGLNGGFEQHFIVRHREKGQEGYTYSKEIKDSQKGERYNYTIKGLKREKEYDVLVVSHNGFNEGSQKLSDVQSVKIEAAPLDYKLLIMGVVIVIVLIVLLAGIIFFIVRRKRTKGPKDDSKALARMANQYQAVPRNEAHDEAEAIAEPESDIYAKPDKTKKKKIRENDGAKANGNKGKSPSNKGRKQGSKSPSKAQPPTPNDTGGQTYENVQLIPVAQPGIVDDDNGDEAVYMNVKDKKEEPRVPDEDLPKLVYADLTFQHIDPKRQEAEPSNEDRVTYDSVDFDKTRKFQVDSN